MSTVIGHIYCVVCLPTGKLYFGQTSKDIGTRWKHHKEDSRYYNYKFYRAIRKYGEDNFAIEEVMWVEAPTKKELKAKLDFLERHFIKRYDTRRNGYNSTDGGDGALGLVMPDAAREKLRLANLGKNRPESVRKKIGNAHRGLKRSSETRERISKAHLGDKNPMFGKRLSFAHKNKIAASMKGKRNALGNVFSKGTLRKMSETKGCPQILQCSKNGRVLETWINISEIKRSFPNVNRESLKRSINRNSLYQGYLWKYKN